MHSTIFCPICKTPISDPTVDEVAFTPEGNLCHADLRAAIGGGESSCEAIAWNREDAVACDRGCGTLLAEGQGDTCAACEFHGPICSSCGDRHHGGPSDWADEDETVWRDEDCNLHVTAAAR